MPLIMTLIEDNSLSEGSLISPNKVRNKCPNNKIEEGNQAAKYTATHTDHCKWGSRFLWGTHIIQKLAPNIQKWGGGCSLATWPAAMPQSITAAAFHVLSFPLQWIEETNGGPRSCHFPPVSWDYV